MWEPCCPRCRRALVEVPDDADPAVLGTCPVHGDVQAGATWIGEPISEEAHRLAASGVEGGESETLVPVLSRPSPGVTPAATAPVDGSTGGAR